MKNLNILVCSIALALAFTGCKKDDEDDKGPAVLNLGPTASFVQTGGDCGAPCEVLFQNMSTNSVSYTWDFGDGWPVSNEATTTVKHTYDSVGIYNVKLIAHGEHNTTSTKVLAVKISGPEARFQVEENSTPDPYDVVVTNMSVFATSYTWDFGDGTPIVTATGWSYAHTYQQSGTYTITLTATNAVGNSSTTSKTVEVEGDPQLENLTSRPFLLTNFYLQDGSQNLNFYNEYPACEKDDLLKINMDGNYQVTDNGSSCAWPEVGMGYWYTQGSNYEQIVLGSSTHYGGYYQILSLTENQMVVSKTSYYQFSSYSGYATGIYTFTAQ